MPSRKSDARRTSGAAIPAALPQDDDSEMTTSQQDTPVPPAEQLAAATLSSEPPADSNHAAAAPSEKGKEKATARDNDTITIEDLNLPKSIITRLAKGVLPPNTQIQANAILALSKSATVFVNHLSNAANEITMLSGKKTIMPADVFRALDDVEYGFMRDRLEAEFAKFNEVQSSKRSAYRRKVSAAKKAQQSQGGSVVGADESMMSTGTFALDEASFMADTTMNTEVSPAADDGGDGGPRAAKKAKVDASSSGRDGRDKGDGEMSDAETVPDEEVEEDDDDDDEEEEEEEDDEESGDERGGGPADDGDELEERVDRGVEDEALDEDSE